MKNKLVVVVFAIFLGIGITGLVLNLRTFPTQAQVASQVKMPEVIILAKDAKMGQVNFNHVSHSGGTYSIDGTGPIACIECHHTAQPASELAKLPPLKTAWPANRITTLTADLFKKDAAAAGVAACRDCHARAGQAPKLLPEVPSIKHEGSTAIINLVNQQAFHRTCDGCHFQVLSQDPSAKVPRPTSCVSCHKPTA